VWVPRSLFSPAAARPGFQNRRTQLVRRIGPPSGEGKIQSSDEVAPRSAMWSVRSFVIELGRLTVRMLFAVFGGPMTTRPEMSETVRRTRSCLRSGSKSPTWRPASSPIRNPAKAPVRTRARYRLSIESASRITSSTVSAVGSLRSFGEPLWAVWAMLVVGSVAAVLTGYPVHRWMVSRGLVRWGPDIGDLEPETRNLSPYQALGLNLTSFAALVAIVQGATSLAG